MIGALNDGDRAVKTAAMDALGTMRYDRAVAALSDLFRYFGKGDFAAAALDALARIANPASVPLFAAQLATRTSSLRGIAIEGLARAGDASRMADVQVALANDRNDGVALAGAFAAAMLANGSVDPIADALTKSKLRDQARQYLVEIAPGRSREFTKQLMDPDPRLRLEVVDVLGLAGDPAALPVIEPLTKDRDAQVAKAAERAVARLHSDRTKLPRRRGSDSGGHNFVAGCRNCFPKPVGGLYCPLPKKGHWHPSRHRHLNL